jgi:hypothetical protein
MKMPDVGKLSPGASVLAMCAPHAVITEGFVCEL